MEVRLYVMGENYGTVAVFMQYPSASCSIAPHKAVLAKIKIFAVFFVLPVLHLLTFQCAHRISYTLFGQSAAAFRAITWNRRAEPSVEACQNGRTGKRHNIRTPERQHIRTLEHQNTGTSERRNVGTSERRNAGMTKCRNAKKKCLFS